MLLKLLTAPLMLFPWKLFIVSLVIISGIGIYSYLTIADISEWIPSLSAPSTPTPNFNISFLWNILHCFILWLVLTVALPFLLIPINRNIFKQQQNQANALLLLATASLSGALFPFYLEKDYF